MSSTINLLPCPFCNNAEIAINNENPKDNSGGYFIECPGCGASTSLRFACGDDPTSLLAEQWNRRATSHCLHQIQEPAAAEQAAWHAGLDEGRSQAAPAAVAVPDGWQLVPMEGTEEMARAFRAETTPALFYMTTIQCADFEERYRAMLGAAPALAATPASAAPYWDGKLPAGLQRALNELRTDCKTDAVNSLEFEVRSVFEGMHTSLATVKRMYHAAQERLELIDAAQPDPFAAAAPVVLPEPDFTQRHEDVCGDEVGPPVGYYSADTVRALVAGVSAPAAPPSLAAR